MTIVIDDNLIGIWYTMTGEKDDYLLSLSRRPEGGLQMCGRTRTYVSDDPWEENDKKNWHTFITKESDEEKAADVCREMVVGVSRIAVATKRLREPAKIWELMKGKSTLEEFLKAFQKLPFAHVKTVKLQ